MIPAVVVGFRTPINDVLRQVKSNRVDQLPFAIALALTNTAKIAATFVAASTPTVFDRPTPTTERAFYTQSATKTKLVAHVYINNSDSSRTRQEKYLQPEVEGGARNLKGFERALLYKGLLPSGMQCVPAAGAEIDSYGNMRSGQIVAILSALSALNGAAYTTNASYVKRAQRGRYKLQKFFVAMPGSHLKPGIYQMLSPRHIIPVVLFVRGITYRARFDFYGIVGQAARDQFKAQFLLAWQQALRTARPL